MVLPSFPIENSTMPKRGPYRRTQVPPPVPAWRKTFLAQWRTMRGWTQEELAERADVSVGTVSGIEAGTNGYSSESLHKLADALGIQAGMILDVNPEGDEPLWAIIAKANAEQRDRIARHARVIVPDKSKKTK